MPWSNDKLQREKYGEMLDSIIENPLLPFIHCLHEKFKLIENEKIKRLAI